MGEPVNLGIDGYGPGVEVGQGATGIVYRSTDQERQPVAIKVISLTNESLQHQSRESRARSQIGLHPGIVEILDEGRNATGAPYIVMPLFSGSAQDWLNERQGWRTVVQLGIEVAEALARARDEGILHRDIKPANILIDEEGRAVVSDFGLAKVASSSVGEISATAGVGMTLAYTALERIRGEPASESSEIYSLGATLCALLVGQHPFATGEPYLDNPGAVLERILASDIPVISPSEAPRPLRELLERSMSSDPPDRPETFEDFRWSLQEIIDRPARDERAPVSWAVGLGTWLQMTRFRDPDRDSGPSPSPSPSGWNPLVWLHYSLRHNLLRLEGRATRREFGSRALFAWVGIGIALALTEVALVPLVFVVSAIPSAIRRCHDAGYGGRLLLLVIVIPFMPLYLLFAKPAARGRHGGWGADPRVRVGSLLGSTGATEPKPFLVHYFRSRTRSLRAARSRSSTRHGHPE